MYSGSGRPCAFASFPSCCCMAVARRARCERQPQMAAPAFRSCCCCADSRCMSSTPWSAAGPDGAHSTRSGKARWPSAHYKRPGRCFGYTPAGEATTPGPEASRRQDRSPYPATDTCAKPASTIRFWPVMPSLSSLDRNRVERATWVASSGYFRHCRSMNCWLSLALRHS